MNTYLDEKGFLRTSSRSHFSPLERNENYTIYVERLWTTTTTNSITDKTRQRSQLREQASQRFRSHRSGAEREEGNVVGREQGATNHKPVIKQNGNGVLQSSSISSCRQDTHHLI
jgi:hypothetical protein